MQHVIWSTHKAVVSHVFFFFIFFLPAVKWQWLWLSSFVCVLNVQLAAGFCQSDLATSEEIRRSQTALPQMTDDAFSLSYKTHKFAARVNCTIHVGTSQLVRIVLYWDLAENRPALILYRMNRHGPLLLSSCMYTLGIKCAVVICNGTWWLNC